MNVCKRYLLEFGSGIVRCCAVNNDKVTAVKVVTFRIYVLMDVVDENLSGGVGETSSIRGDLNV